MHTQGSESLTGASPSQRLRPTALPRRPRCVSASSLSSAESLGSDSEFTLIRAGRALRRARCWSSLPRQWLPRTGAGPREVGPESAGANLLRPAHPSRSSVAQPSRSSESFTGAETGRRLPALTTSGRTPPHPPRSPRPHLTWQRQSLLDSRQAFADEPLPGPGRCCRARALGKLLAPIGPGWTVTARGPSRLPR